MKTRIRASVERWPKRKSRAERVQRVRGRFDGLIDLIINPVVLWLGVGTLWLTWELALAFPAANLACLIVVAFVLIVLTVGVGALVLCALLGL